MQEKELIHKAMETAKINQVALQKILGLKSQSSVSSYLHGKSMRVETFLKVLNSIGYEVIVKGHDKEWTVGENSPDESTSTIPAKKENNLN
jgi:hypothetical protein